MSKIAELRKRSQETNMELQKQKIGRIQDAVRRTLESNSFVLTVADSMGNKALDEETMKKVVQDISEGVSDAYMNPVNKFIDACKARGMELLRIQFVVEKINELFTLTDSDVYEDQLEAVALYMEQHPSLYDDIGLLS